MTARDFQTRLAHVATLVEARLAILLGDGVLAGEIARPQRLMAAMRHAVLGGGKRLRPFLVVETAGLFGLAEDAALDAAAAVECIHCYSLVHDDLPAMDDDDMRRGRPTVHRAFDEATAILAGDALLTLAFDILGRTDTAADPAVRADLVLGLARASGLAGMVGGQMLDLAAETADVPLDEAAIRRLQAMKTGALIAFSAEAGAILGKASADEHAALAAFGRTIGLAFQLADDLLDVEGDAATLGKAAAKDAERGKATLVSLHGVEATRRHLAGLVAEADALLAPFGARADTLRAAARFVAERRH
ncbi:MAG TPA: polyprenyl synthetase family protein [Hyphomicrobiales bacterium]|nr:polyprenyl synthetase family protein [Kaistiaceae bacterium]HQF30198.1 polyprenyl synthetase family protein [Hyphomicrobiales bacterium]